MMYSDLKPANLLIDAGGVVKLADFGLARTYGSPEELTNEVVTRWYRAPELLFGAPLYSGAVDMWAVGCIFAELIFRVPLFPGMYPQFFFKFLILCIQLGNTDLEQLAKIFNVLGTPNATNWPGVEFLPSYVEFEARDPLDLRPLFGSSSVLPGTSSPANMDLLKCMLTLNPQKRVTASQVRALFKCD